MDEIKVNSFNEETLNEVSGGMHYGIIEGSVFYKGVLCYKYRILSGDTLSSIAQHFGFWHRLYVSC